MCTGRMVWAAVVAQWFERCQTNQEVVGSIPEGLAFFRLSFPTFLDFYVLCPKSDPLDSHVCSCYKIINGSENRTHNLQVMKLPY